MLNDNVIVSTALKHASLSNKDFGTTMEVTSITEEVIPSQTSLISLQV